MSIDTSLAEHPVVRDIADFDRQSGSRVERALFNHRFVVLALCAIVSVLLAWQATGLRLGASFEKMIPTKHPYIANYLANRSELAGLGNSVRIAGNRSDPQPKARKVDRECGAASPSPHKAVATQACRFASRRRS